MSQPPLLPEVVLARVRVFGWRHGLSILLVSGVAALLNAAVGERLVAIAAVLAAGAGVMEMHGADLLGDGDERGVNWLIGAELLLLAIILGYCGWRLTHVDLTAQHEAVQGLLKYDFFREAWRLTLEREGISETELLLRNYRTTYGALAVAALVYQGCVALYYARRRAAIAQALAAETGTET
ncbi:MAG: hypothetical protein RLZZ15_2222 [Verrucomicrobiota bacterium]|jgi:hypothetical protein